MPWIEDLYLRYFTKDNKASYTTKRKSTLSPSSSTSSPSLSSPLHLPRSFQIVPTPTVPNLLPNAIVSCLPSALPENLDKSKVTGISQVDTIQDGVNNMAAGQVGQGGLLQPIGDMASREGLNRAERGGKDDKGGYAPNHPVADSGKNAVGKVADGAKGAGGYVADGAKSAGGLVGGVFGGGNKK